jgi:hypothetical protein
LIHQAHRGGGVHDGDKMQRDATRVNRKKQTISRGMLCGTK